MMCVQNVLRLKLYLQKINKKINKHFLQNSPLVIQHTYSSEFPHCQRTSEILNMVLRCAIEFLEKFPCSQLSLEVNFQFKKKKKNPTKLKI